MRKRACGALIGAALVAAAFATVGAAPANAIPTAICATAMLECSSGNAYNTGTTVKAKLVTPTVATFTYTGGPVQCKTSEIIGETMAKKGSPLVIRLSEVNFGTCTKSGSNCSAFVYHLPYNAGLSALGSYQGSLQIGTGGTGAPELKLACNLSCIFGASAVELSVASGPLVTMTATNVPLALTGGNAILCGSSATFSANYEWVTPNPAYVTYAGF
jgi:hypothetical protein